MSAAAPRAPGWRAQLAAWAADPMVRWPVAIYVGAELLWRVLMGSPRAPALPAGAGDVLRRLGTGGFALGVTLVLGLLALLVARLFSLEEMRPGRLLAAFGSGLVAVVLVSRLARPAHCFLFGGPACEPAHPLAAFGVYAGQSMTFFSLLAIWYGLFYARRRREHELAEGRLSARLAEARLAVLKAQLHPHFLFNTLNSVAALMHRDVPAAEAMLDRLQDLLELSLARARAQEVPLAEELRFLELYAGIERVRFSDRLDLEVAVDEEVRGALVPHLLLQPLVENSIRHGIAARPGPGRIEVRAGAEGERLVIRVSDDGPGAPAARGPNGSGVGLANTRARLEHLYGERQSMEMESGAAGGFAVTITLPLRPAPAEAPAPVGAAA